MRYIALDRACGGKAIPVVLRQAKAAVVAKSGPSLDLTPPALTHPAFDYDW